MAVEQKVVIRVEIDPDMSKAAAITAFTNTLEKRLGRTNKALARVSSGFERGLGQAIGNTLRRLADFGKAILKLNFKGLALELGLVTAGLLAMKATLASGKAIMRAWDSTVSFARVAVAGLAGGVIALVSALAAANRQFSQMQLSPFIGGIHAARTALRAPMADAGLGVMGMQAITQAASTMGRAGVSKNTTALMREMGNIASGDPKQFQAMAQAIAQVKQSGSGAAGADLFKGMGPQFASQAAAAGSMSADEFIKALSSGELTPDAFAGQLDKLNNTLMGRMKGLITRFYTQFADMGAIFLEPLTNALNDIEFIFARTLFRVRGTIQEFGLNDFIPGLVNSMEKFTNWITTIIIRDLPRLMEVMGKISDWWASFKAGSSRFFTDLGESMERFRAAGDASWQMVKNLFGEIGDFVGGRFETWKESIEETREAFEQFGTSLGKLIAGALTIMTQYKDEFFNILPELNKFITYIADEVFPVMADFATQFVKAFKTALPVIQMVVSAFLPLLKVLNSLIGVIADLPGGLGGLAVLAGGYFGLSRMGRVRAGAFGTGAKDAMAASGRSFSGALRPTTGNNQFAQEAGRRFGASRMGQWVHGRGQAAVAARGGGMILPGQRGAGTFQDSQGRWRDAGGRYASGPAKFIQGSGAGRHLNWRALRGATMGAGTMTALGMGSMMAGQMIGGEGGAAFGQAGMMGTMGMMAGGEKYGARAGLAGMGLSMAKTAWNARTAKGGMASGAAAGASLVHALGLQKLPFATLAGAIVGGIAGGIKGWWNRKKLEEAGRELAAEFIESGLEAVNDAVGREAIEAAGGAIDDLLENETALKALATERGVSYDALRESLMEDSSVSGAVPGAIRRLDDAISHIAAVTGMGADEVEAQANDLGIALQSGAKAVGDFIRSVTQDFAEMGKAEWNDVINTAMYDSWQSNKFATLAATNEASGQGRASTQALMEHLATGGTMEDEVGAQLTSDWISSAMNQGQAQGLTGTALQDYVYKSSMGLEAANAHFGIDSSKFDPLRTEADERLGVTMENFLASSSVEALRARGTTLGISANDMSVLLDRAFRTGDTAGELATLTERIYSKAADSIARLGEEGDATATEMVNMRNRLLSGEVSDLDEPVTPRAPTRQAVDNPSGQYRPLTGPQAAALHSTGKTSITDDLYDYN